MGLYVFIQIHLAKYLGVATSKVPFYKHYFIAFNMNLGKNCFHK